MECSDRRKHGGNIVAAEAKYGLPAESFIDFSASINPLGVPRPVREAVISNLHLLMQYPDPSASVLRQAIGEFLGVSPEHIIAGNGASELIYLAARVLKPKRALLLHPTFGEYGPAVVAAGGTQEVLLLPPETGFHLELRELTQLPQLKGIDLIFLCNPNNPTGRTWTREEVLELVYWAAPRGIEVVVDEAFMDFVDDSSQRQVVGWAPGCPNLLVLRSLTKVFALAGLRLGYAVGRQSLIERLGFSRDPWSVNWLAQVAGVAALADQDYLLRTRQWIKEERKHLYHELRRLPDLEVWPTEANYFLLRLNGETTVHQLMQHLGPRGILVRNGSSFPGLGPQYFRVAVRTRAENQRLVEELKIFLSDPSRYNTKENPQ